MNICYRNSFYLFILLIGLLVSSQVQSKTLILDQGQVVKPYELSLAFGKKIINDEVQKTTKGSLIATPFSEGGETAVRFKWRSKGVKNKWGSLDKNVHTVTIINREKHTDFSNSYQQKALNIRTKVLQQSDGLVELTMECKWDWQCRSSVQIKAALNDFPKGEWADLTIPLSCFNKNKMDLSKVTTPFILHTSGKLELEISSISVVNLSQPVTKC